MLSCNFDLILFIFGLFLMDSFVGLLDYSYNLEEE